MKIPKCGAVTWHPSLNAFRCEACGEWFTLRDRAWQNPERMATLRELVELDHVKCWSFIGRGSAMVARRALVKARRAEWMRARADRAFDRMAGIGAGQ